MATYADHRNNDTSDDLCAALWISREQSLRMEIETDPLIYEL